MDIHEEITQLRAMGVPRHRSPAVAAARTRVKRLLRRRGIAIDPNASSNELLSTALILSALRKEN